MKAFKSLLLANFRQFTRERTAMFWTFAFPLFFILIFGAVFSGGGHSTYPIGVVVQDSSTAAQGLQAALQQVPALQVQGGTLDAELAALKKGDLRLVVVVDQGFGASLAGGAKGQVDIYYDPTRTETVQMALPIVQKVLDGYNQSLAGTPSLIQVNPKTLQSHDLRSVDYLVPGILAMALMQLGMFAAVPLVVDRENKVLKRLGATPLRRSTMVISTVAFRLCIALVQAALVITVAQSVFHVPMLGNWLFLLAMVLLGALTFIAMGYMLSAFARTQETITPMLMAIQFPMMFLSGIFFPVDIMPGFMKPLMQAMPLTYLGDAMRQIMVQSTPIHSYAIDIGVLGAWLAGCLAVAVRFFKWE